MSKPRILVAEDDELVQGTIRRTFRGIAVELHFAGNGREALKMLPDGFDFIISDVSMPFMNGIELFKQIRTEFPEKCLNFVFFSSEDPKWVQAELDEEVPVFDKSAVKYLCTFVREILAV